jgi:hypothetical protein
MCQSLEGAPKQKFQIKMVQSYKHDTWWLNGPGRWHGSFRVESGIHDRLEEWTAAWMHIFHAMVVRPIRPACTSLWAASAMWLPCLACSATSWREGRRRNALTVTGHVRTDRTSVPTRQPEYIPDVEYKFKHGGAQYFSNIILIVV